MNRLRIMLLSIAVFSAVGTALATRPHFDCTFATQYYYNGSAFVPAGRLGYEYSCGTGAGVCTWYKPDPIFNPDYYQPCRTGIFQILD